MTIFKTKLFFFSLALSGLLVACDPVDPTPQPGPSRAFTHLDLGNPTNADENPTNTANYLLKKSTYAMSYNNVLRHANWVSWELNDTYLGSTDRTDDFQPDMSLPAGFYQVTPNDYSRTGFDRGHILPSADRTYSIAENQETFLMSNMLPQAPQLNRVVWNNLEQYCRSLVRSGYRLFIVAGAYGNGGQGSEGEMNVLPSGVDVPERNYKVIVATKKASVSSLTNDAVIIAADFPNDNDLVANRDWVRFLTTPAAIEKDAGIKLFTGIATGLQTDFKSRLFLPENAPLAIETTCKKYNGRELYVGRDGGCYYFTTSGNKSYVDRTLCDCQ